MILTYSLSTRIRKLLRDGPATGHEVAVLLGIPLRQAQEMLWSLCHHGSIRKTGRTAPSDCGGKARQLYELTARGRKLAAAPRREPSRWGGRPRIHSNPLSIQTDDTREASSDGR